MGRRARWFLGVTSIATLLPLSVGLGVASSDERREPSSARDASPTAFAERVTATRTATATARTGESLQGILELIALAAVCAIGVAFYSSATTSGGDDRSTSSRPRRR